MPAAAETVLELRDVHTHYGASHILRGVSFSLRRGECISLMGRNGMGKTTALRSIMGLVRPSRGSVVAFGRDTRRLATYRIAASGVAYVPEGRGIFPNLTVRENLVMAARAGVGGRRDWTLETVLELFPNLAERAGSSGAALSGGEQQMLTIGRALMTNPAIMLLDEATEGLAPLVREEIWRVIARIKRAGIACIVVDKNVGKLIDVADRHVILVKGEVVFDADGAALMQDPDFLHRHLGV
ncbi:MAG: ABC transporter ATP-binding protein [Rhodospirillales bacterium]|nr:ABC transporter ATP-binding protein [Rhodospirillales bacterium]